MEYKTKYRLDDIPYDRDHFGSSPLKNIIDTS